MNSLLQKEGMAGKVQMIYIDPPYGIKYNSNFQPFMNKTMVHDNNDSDIPAEPEMIRAFRDTWELGIHSYLTHLRDRLLLAKELLNESGSVFVQISDENVHQVREVLDEIFQKENFFAEIVFTKKNMPLGSAKLFNPGDYIIWYCKDLKKIKYNKLYHEKIISKDTLYCWGEFPNGTIRSLEKYELDKEYITKNQIKVFLPMDVRSSGYSQSMDFPVEIDGKEFHPTAGKSWATTETGMKKLMEKNRIFGQANTLRYKLYLDDYPVSEISNLWADTRGEVNRIYVVQTATQPIQRCILMSTDPGDLVLDPTCGSGTTAYVAEQWGRRWITCDTSRVAITLTKQRLMTAKYEYYELAHPDEGVKSGFKYKTVPHVTLGSIVNGELPKEETLYDQSHIDTSKVRVTGPFTVEAVPSLRTKPFNGELPEIAESRATENLVMWIEELKATGVRATGGKIIEFANLEPMSGTHYLHAQGEIIDKGNYKKSVISFGPDYGPIEQRQVEEVVKEARQLKDRPSFIVFAAFHFDPEASKDIDEMKLENIKILKAQMSVDILTHDLRRKRSSNQSYWLIGQPDVDIVSIEDNMFKVQVKGFDYYNPVTGAVDSGSIKKIAMWMLDSDYDERSLFPEQVFFPMGDKKRDWTKLAKSLNGEVDEEKLEVFVGTESLPFKPGNHKKVAVKIIDDRGIESFVVKKL